MDKFTKFDFISSLLFKGSFTLECSRAERSKDQNKATAVTTKLQQQHCTKH